MTLAIADGTIRGLLLIGPEPGDRRAQQPHDPQALPKLEWMVVRDMFESETASYWYKSPEVSAGELKPEDIKTEIFLLPAALPGGEGRDLHQHPPPDPVARQGGRAARRHAAPTSGSSTTWAGG